MITPEPNKDSASARASHAQSVLICVYDRATLGSDHDINRLLARHDGRLVDGGLPALIRYMRETGASPSTIFVEFRGEPSGIMQSLHELADLLPDTTQVFGSGTINDIGFYQSLRSMGLADYFVVPVSIRQIESAIENSNASRSNAYGVVISAIGMGGGVGTSSFVFNLAYHAATQFKCDIGLIDTNPVHASWRALMPTPSTSETSNITPVHHDDHSEPLYEQVSVGGQFRLILPTGRDAGVARQISSKPASLSIMDQLRMAGTHVIVDIGQSGDADAILSISDHIILVAEPDYKCFARSSQVITDLAASYPYARLHLVLNRIGQRDRIEFTSDEFAKRCAIPAHNAFRNDFSLMAKAYADKAPVLPLSLLKDPRCIEQLLVACNLIDTEATRHDQGLIGQIKTFYRRVIGGGA